MFGCFEEGYEGILLVAEFGLPGGRIIGMFARHSDGVGWTCALYRKKKTCVGPDGVSLCLTERIIQRGLSKRAPYRGLADLELFSTTSSIVS